MADLEQLLKASGLTLDGIKGKSISSIKKLVADNIQKALEEEEKGKRQVCIDNAKNLIPQIKEKLQEPFVIGTEPLLAGITANIGQVVGYIPSKSSVIVFYNDKCYVVNENKILKDIKDFDKKFPKKEKAVKKAKGK